jgi:hypothetical protein
MIPYLGNLTPHAKSYTYVTEYEKKYGRKFSQTEHHPVKYQKGYELRAEMGDYDTLVNQLSESVGLSPILVRSRCRERCLPEVRFAMFYILHVKCQLSLKKVGTFFSGYDHSSVYYGLDRVKKSRSGKIVVDADIDNSLRWMLILYEKWYEQQVEITKQLYKPIGS